MTLSEFRHVRAAIQPYIRITPVVASDTPICRSGSANPTPRGGSPSRSGEMKPREASLYLNEASRRGQGCASSASAVCLAVAVGSGPKS